MASFDRLFGDKPRVHMLEALLNLVGLTFTRAEWAEAAGLHKTSVNNVADDLEREGFIRRVTDGAHPEYEVVATSPYVRILNALDAALELVETNGDAVANDATEAFRKRAIASVLAAHNVTPVTANLGTVRTVPGSGITLRRPSRKRRVYQQTSVTTPATGGGGW
jgi:DNA-binding MarR family transcriptional regulator